MRLWAFRFILWYICILMVQPQNRFTFLWPLRIANLSFILGTGLHVFCNMEDKTPILRLGPGSILAFCLITFAAISQQFGVYQISSAWNPYLDIIVKNALLLIMIEATATTVERVWAVQMTALFATLWWVKSGLRLFAAGATYSGDRLMGASVSLIENPNGFAYMMCVFLPLYLYAFQQAPKKWIKLFFLACALSAVFIVFQTGSRTGLLTLICMGAFLMPYYGRRHLKGLLAIIVAVVLLFPLSGEQNMERFKTIPQSIRFFLSAEGDTRPTAMLSQDEQSADERQAKNRDTWLLIKDNLLFGVGVWSDYAKYDRRYPMAQGQVHCEILMAGRQMGLIGMTMYVGFVSIIFFGGWWIRLVSHDWPAVRDLGWTFQMHGLAIAVGGAFSPLPWNAPMMLFAGATSALVGILRRERDAQRVQLAGY